MASYFLIVYFIFLNRGMDSLAFGLFLPIDRHEMLSTGPFGDGEPPGVYSHTSLHESFGKAG